MRLLFLVPVTVFQFRRGEARLVRVLAETAEGAWNSLNGMIERAAEDSFDISCLGVFPGIDRIEIGELEEVELLGSFRRIQNS